jgi:hypothetical protein
MKKAIVLLLAALAVLGVFALSLNARHASPSYLSADKYADMPMVVASPSAAPPVEAEEQNRPMQKERAKKDAAPSPKRGLLKIIGGGGEGSVGALDDVLGSSAGAGDVASALSGASGVGAAHAAAGGKGAARATTEEPSQAATRAWFPETFLFEPLVVTDANGRANVPVKVPDRLTTWRVLALAHSREGGQAGAVASFLGTLPTYVEPVTPAFLYAGDEVRLPVQLVNTTEHDVSSPLLLSATGASLAAAGGAVRVPALGNVVQFATLTTRLPGTVKLRAALGDTDAVEKTFPVQPAGLRAVQSKGGTLAAPRTFTLTGPADTLPGTESLRLRVFPGALGLVKSELAAAPGRGGVAEDAYLLQLLGQAPALLHSLGAEADQAVVRELSLLATQRVMRHARTPSVDAATLLTEAALAHPQNPVLSRLGERLAATVAQSQRGDGTCQGATGWTLQRLLVTTADCVRAVRAGPATPQAKQRATAVSVKAAGAFERNLGRITDGYTAAAVLASGVATGTLAEGLKKLVLDNVKGGDDGAKYLDVSSGVVRADGRAPSVAEATAMAILALGEDPVVADLGTTLLAGYSSLWGWGDGRANLVGLRAAVQLFKAPVPAGVKISLTRDGTLITQGTLDAAAIKDVLTLDADSAGSSGAHEWKLVAEPPVPGLGYSLQLVAFTPWKTPEAGGLALTVTPPASLVAGQAADLALLAAFPASTEMKLTVPLPAGVQHDTPSLDALVSAGRITRYETQDGLVTLHVAPQPAGATWSTTFKVVPTFSGTLQSGPPTLAPEGAPWREKAFAPSTWVVK